MDDNMKDFIADMINGMPDDLKEVLKKAVYARSDAMVSNPEIRKQKRIEIEAIGDPDTIRGFEAACNMYDLNVQAVQLLGNIKAILRGFDENNLSSANLKSNLTLIKQLHMMIALSMESMGNKINALEDNNNEDGAGNTSGSGAG